MRELEKALRAGFRNSAEPFELLRIEELLKRGGCRMETGNFVLNGSSFLVEGKKLVIRQRKKASSKPELYLIQIEPFQYISSLFPVEGEEAFTFDFERKLYKLRKRKNLVEVEQLTEA